MDKLFWGCFSFVCSIGFCRFFLDRLLWKTDYCLQYTVKNTFFI